MLIADALAVMDLDISNHVEEIVISNNYGNIVRRRRYQDGRDFAPKYKPSDFFNRSEADMMGFASKMGVKTPHVYGCLDGPEDWTILVSDYVPGESLLKVWPRLNNYERSSIKEQLREQLGIMRQCKMPYIGRAGEQPIRDVFDPIRFSFSGPFMTEKEFD